MPLKMSLKKQEAYKILGLEENSPDSEYNFVKLSEAIYSKIRNPTDPEAVKRFQELKDALLTLNTGSHYKNYSLEDMFAKFALDHIDEEVSDDEYSIDEEENEKPQQYLPMSISAEEASRNARELIEEEEKEKRRAEKKKASKKRRKQKKKSEKNDSKEKVDNSAAHPSTEAAPIHLASSDHEEAIDPNSAFVANIAKSKTRKKTNSTQVANKNTTKSTTTSNNTGKQGGKGTNKSSKQSNKQQPPQPPSKDTSEEQEEEEEEEDEDEEEEEIDEMKTESYRLNELGKNLALEERFQEAITYFTEAIELNPSQPSFLDNRSYCFTSLQKYKRALKDAKKALELDCLRPQGYFRMGQAYIGLKEYVKSEECFLKVLELEPNCPDARQELYTIKMLQLMDMGITAEQARAALAVNSTVEQATEWIYEGNCPNFPSVDEEEVYISEDEAVPEVVVPERKPQPAAPSSRTNSTPNTTPSSTYNHIDIKMDPRNPEKSSTLWVGNIGADLQEKALRNLFAKYGTVISHKVVKDPAKNRNYAFINFSNPESASNAMKALQGKFFGGDNLRLRFPDNTKASKNNSDTKKVGPVMTQNGLECRHYRQGYCAYGHKCNFKHIASNEGIDKSKH